MNAPQQVALPGGGSLELRRAIWAPKDRYMQAVRLSLVIGVLALAPSWYMFEVYGRVLNSRNPDTLAWLLVAAIGIYVVLELLELARARVLRQASSTIENQLNQRVFNAIFVAKLNKQPGGGTQPLADVRALADFVHSPALSGMLDAPSSLICLLLLFGMNVWVGVLATVMAALNVGLGLLQQRNSALPYGEAMGASGEAQGRAAGTLRNAQVIEAMGMQGSMYKRWIKSQRQFILSLSNASDSAGTIGTGTKMLAQLQGSLLLALACWMALRNELWGGMSMVIVASILGGRVLQPIAQVVGQWRQIGAAQVAFKRLDNLLKSMPPAQPGMPLPAPKGLLTAENLQVTPPGSSAPVLKGVNFFARPGELLTIFGASAAGKSTLARVLIGVWPSQGGKVRLDGVDVYSWHKSQLGPHVGYLPQGVELFDGTVAENIARFGKVDMDLVKQAAEQAGITGLVADLPDGFETQIGDEGAILSGGQRQRVGLARALYGSPQLLVLDEPNSSLDEAGDRELQALIQAQKARGATLVAITHRKSLLMAADNLLLLHEGTVGKFGPRDEVLAALQAAAEQAAKAQAARNAQATAPNNPAQTPAPTTGAGA